MQFDLKLFIEQKLPFLVPSFAALIGTSTLVVLSSIFSNKKKFISFIFTVTLSLSFFVVIKNEKDFDALWWNFCQLKEELRFVLSVLIISVVYFGGSFFTTTPQNKLSNKKDNYASYGGSPACSDDVTTFEVPPVLPDSDAVLFEEIFVRLKDEIIQDLEKIYEMNSEASQWVDRMIQYTVAGGKMNRGLALMNVQATFAKARGVKMSNKERCQSAALGWCIEFLQAFFLVADDAMDDSVTRRGQPCWFRLPNVKLIAINDSFILESCVYKILKRYFGRETYYHQLVELFIEVTRQTEMGQLLDLTSQPLTGPIDLFRFTSERHALIVKYKTAFYSFYLPVALGMIAVGITDVQQYNKAREILMIMGEYFQVQDDYLDCYASAEVLGKIGTDIQDNKCSWLIVKALDIATTEQKKLLLENYGKHDEKCIEKVKKIFIDLKLEDLFMKYEEESYTKLKKLIASVKDMPVDIFEFLLKKIYKRSK